MENICNLCEEVIDKDSDICDECANAIDDL